MKEYKVVVYQESLLGSLVFGGSKVDPESYAEFLNEHAKEGWEVVTLERESRRMLLFFSREAFITLLVRNRK